MMLRQPDRIEARSLGGPGVFHGVMQRGGGVDVADLSTEEEQVDLDAIVSSHATVATG